MVVNGNLAGPEIHFELRYYFELNELFITNFYCTSHPFGRRRLESGQSCPELERPVCICVPSDKPDKGLSKQGQNRKRRDRPDSSRLAQPGVLSTPFRSRDRLSNNSPTETAQQTFSHHLHPLPWNLNLHSIELIKGFHKERGFSEALAQGLAIFQR